jgi:signal transduction histidine kinase
MIAGRLALNPWLGTQSNRHLVFLPTVMLAAWFAGLAPGLVAAALCTSALVLFYTEPLRLTADVLLFFLIATAIAALMESLRRARARADEAARAREQMLAVVAHDLRNPLAAIAWNTSALAQASADPKMRRRVAAIEQSARRMDTLISDLVEATRLEHGGVQLTLAAEDVDGIVQETAEMFGPAARDKGLTIEARPAGGLTAMCDRERVMQVLGNLVGNALRFTPEGGRITLRTEPQQDRVRFEVQDTGAGIPSQDLPHIFERYWNSDRKGSGLGLYIAQNLVHAHGGQIGVDTRLGQGSTFFFMLPRARQAPESLRAVIAGPLEHPAG